MTKRFSLPSLSLVSPTIIIACLLLVGCQSPSYKANLAEVDVSTLSKIQTQIVELSGELKGQKLQVNMIGTANETPVLMVHGTPGSWQSFRYIMSHTELQKEFHLAASNRLGWNTSEDEELTQSITEVADFKKQAAAIAAVIREFSPNKPVILSGHSLGASIVPRVALDYPNLVAGLLLISGTTDPELGHPRWYNRLSKYKPVNIFLPKGLKLANKEIINLQKNLQEQASIWETLDIPVSVIQGKQDKLVSPKNARFAENNLSRLGGKFTLYELDDAGHFTIWENIPEVAEALRGIKQQLSK